MFNALNRFMSRLDGAEHQQRQHDGGSFGFQVLRNTTLGLSIEPWFDYVVGINGRPLDGPNPILFAQEIRNCAGRTVTLGLWNAKGQRTREMHIPVPVDTATLGLSLQYAPLSLAANVWHVLDVAPNSPAADASLLPYSDYILGSPEGTLGGESALGELVEDHIGRPLRLYIYNNEYDVTRELTIQPSRDWGGEGALGCMLGYGALHRLPAPLSEPVNGPGETMFDGDINEKTEATLIPAASAAQTMPASQLLVPAQVLDSVPVNASSKPGKKKERHSHRGQNQLMDDYFKEEEKRSRELDNAPTPKASGVPPPPKAPAAIDPPTVGPTEAVRDDDECK
ncbi:hypothetical protein CDD82_4476 [Ophiocordyceps australis]|uniref:PDZ GRASP-type domain-containing protein n=1 Tax=Ophiocordyceps australis TaxID=1399860 RepID=A0A2C5Z0M4_9HYPO|nr:hypothetical protein CDD82_4476 [Ophiocordyceps australis]